MNTEYEYFKLQQSMSKNLQVLVVDPSEKTKEFKEKLCAKGGYRSVTFTSQAEARELRISPAQYKAFDVDPSLPLVVCSFPYDDAIKLKSKTTEGLEKIPKARMGMLKQIETSKNVVLNDEVPIVFIGNIPENQAKVIATKFPNNTIWLLGRGGNDKHRVVSKWENMDQQDQGVKICCTTHGAKSGDDEIATKLYCYNHSAAQFEPTNHEGLYIPKRLPLDPTNVATLGGLIGFTIPQALPSCPVVGGAAAQEPVAQVAAQEPVAQVAAQEPVAQATAQESVAQAAAQEPVADEFNPSNPVELEEILKTHGVVPDPFNMRF